MDPQTERRERFIERFNIEKIILDGYHSDLELLQLLLTGEPDASDLLGCYHFRRNEPRLAADYFYDKMTPTPPVQVLFVRYVQVMAARGFDCNSIALALCYLRNENCVAILSILIADIWIDYWIVLDLTLTLISMCDFCRVSIPSMFTVLQLLSSVRVSDPERNERYLHEAANEVASYLLDRFDRGNLSEDEQSRLAALIDGLEAKNELLFSGRSPARLEFLIDRCRCNPNYVDQDGRHFLNYLGLGEPDSEDEQVVRFLLDRGVHPCVRSQMGVPIFKAFPNIILAVAKLRVRTLQCLAASKITEQKKMDYARYLPKRLCRFVELH